MISPLTRPTSKRSPQEVCAKDEMYADVCCQSITFLFCALQTLTILSKQPVTMRLSPDYIHLRTMISYVNLKSGSRYDIWVLENLNRFVLIDACEDLSLSYVVDAHREVLTR